MTGFPLDPLARARVREGWAELVWGRDEADVPFAPVEVDIAVLGWLPACRDGDHNGCDDDGTGCLCDHHLGGDS